MLADADLWPEKIYLVAFLHMWLMIGQKTAKCDMRVLRVPVTWFCSFFLKIPTQNPCDMRDMRDIRFVD